MPASTIRRTAAALTSLAVAGAAAILVPTPADAAAARTYGGSSYGVSARFGDVVTVGRTANQPLCTMASNVTRSNNTARTDLGELGSVGAQVTTVRSVKSGSTQSSITTSQTAGLSLLDGAVTLDGITAEARVTLDSSGYRLRGKTTVTGLVVLGRAITTSPAPNTIIELPGNGRVILNQQGTVRDFGIRTQGVNGLRLILDRDNDAGLPAGQLTVSYALASLHSPTFNRPYGTAYATRINVGDTVRSGSTATVHLPCGGSSGKTRTNNVARLNATGAFTAGTAETSAKSTDSAASTNATTRARIADVNLLDGRVTADAVTAVSSTTRQGRTVTRSSAGTAFTNLRIGGSPVRIGTGANQRFSVAGVGTLHVRRTVWAPNGIDVYALQLVLSQDQGDLPAGAVINVGSAQSGVA